MGETTSNRDASNPKADGAAAAPQMQRILVVEDDPATAEAISAAVASVGAEPIVMTSLASGIEASRLARFSVIVMDRMLPGGDGIDAIAEIRAGGSEAMILVVSALGRATNKIEGLERGADDYLAKPFDPAELQARLRALLRRGQVVTSDNDLMVFGPLEIRLKARTVHVGQTHVACSPKEFELITFFARNVGQIVTRMQLLEAVWNLHFDPQTNVVDVHIGRLRKKLEAASPLEWIETRRGEGYIFMPHQAVS